MEWQEAIKQSKKGTAVRVKINNGKVYITIRYRDGSGFILVGENHKVDFTNSREARPNELEGFLDWEPSL